MVIDSHIIRNNENLLLPHEAISDLTLLRNKYEVRMRKRARDGETVGHIHQDEQRKFMREATANEESEESQDALFDTAANEFPQFLNCQASLYRAQAKNYPANPQDLASLNIDIDSKIKERIFLYLQFFFI
jgi:hypothetical protein